MNFVKPSRRQGVDDLPLTVLSSEGTLMSEAMKWLSLVLVIASVFMAKSVQAAFIVYTTRTAWESAAGGPPAIFDDFNNLAVDLDLDTPGVTRGSVTYSTPLNGWPKLDVAPFDDWRSDVNGTPFLAALLHSDPPHKLTINFAVPVTSWGADVNPNWNDLSDYIWVDTNGADDGSYQLPLADLTEFRGFITNSPFTSMTLSIGYRYGYHGIDNMGAHPVLVPEPCSFANAGLWALVGGLALRWRNAAAKKRVK